MNQQILNSLLNSNLEFIRVVWCDNANIIRAKAIHRDALSHHLAEGVGISPSLQALPVMYDAPSANSGLTVVGEIRLIPDWSTYNILPYSPTHARVMGNFMKNGQPWSLCPRYFLARMIDQAAELGLTIKAAFENEFYLLNPNGQPTDHTLFAATYAMDIHQPVIDEICQALMNQGISIEQYYPESGPGQQEISIGYTEVMKAADQQIIFRETVKAIARQHKLIASFLPKIFPDHAGSGCHIHFSLWSNDGNIVSSDQTNLLSDQAQKFTAGILQNLPALMLLTTPSINSYRRFIPQCWSGAFQIWGYDNKEAAIRIPSLGDRITNIELKTVDATANPYLALGSLIALGLQGIRDNAILPPPTQFDPGTLGPEEQAKQSFSRLPSNLGEAIAHFKNNPILNNALGSDLSQAYLAIKETEWNAMKNYDLSQEVALLLERY